MPSVCVTPFDVTAPLPEETATIAESLFSQVAIKHGDAFVSLNVDEIRPGDVIVFEGHSKASSNLRVAQTYLFGASTASWTHCAIIDQNFSIWDAMPGEHVRCRALSDLLRRSERITAVRPVPVVYPERLGRSLLQFSDGLYRPFRIQTGGRFLARLAGAGVFNPPMVQDRDTVCSLFVANVLRHATRYGFFADLPLALPPDFLTHSDFTLLPLRWARLSP